MKRTELKFPSTVMWRRARTSYTMTQGSDKGRVDLTDVQSGKVYANHNTKETMLDIINDGTVVVISEPKEADLTITVDSSALTRTIAEMKEATAVAIDLEAALLRVKALLA